MHQSQSSSITVPNFFINSIYSTKRPTRGQFLQQDLLPEPLKLKKLISGVESKSMWWAWWYASYSSI